MGKTVSIRASAAHIARAPRTWVEVPGRGKIVSHTTIHRPHHDGFNAERYVFAAIEIEGAQLYAQVPGADRRQLADRPRCYGRVRDPWARSQAADVPLTHWQEESRDGESFDPAAVGLRIPGGRAMLYLDSAIRRRSPRARAALESFYDEGLEQAGPKALWLDRVEQVRARIAALIGADPSEIAFTKNTSEGLNIAANAIPFAPGDNVMMVDGDHPNNAYAFLNLRRKGVEVRFLPLKGETATADMFAAHIDGRTRAISLSHVTFHSVIASTSKGSASSRRRRGSTLSSTPCNRSEWCHSTPAEAAPP